VAATMYWRERYLRRFGRKLNSEDSVETSGRGIPETHLCVGEGPVLFMELPDRELGPCEGPLQGQGNLARFSIP
jgi:hypothetical protein